MTERPADIRIEDLENPIFPPEVQKAFADAAPLAKKLHFNLDALMSEAVQNSGGLDDFGSEEYVEPLTVLCESITKESNFSPMGFISSHAQIMGALRNRLRVEDFYKHYPDANDIKIDNPIIIAGLPRSGTTHLHNLISSDKNLRSLPWWESLEPIPSKEEWDNPEPRIQRAKDGVAQRDILMPHFNRMHEMTWDHVHEEISLLIIAGSSMQFDTMGVLPSWREYYKSSDQTPYYMYVKKILKALSHFNGKGKRWILKSPQHLEQFQPIMNTFPTATVLVTHRDPLSVVASMATMLSYSARLAYSAPINVKRIGQWWRELLKDMLNACVADRELLPENQSMDILFHQFMSNDIETVKNAYLQAGQEWNDTVEGAMKTYMESHPRGRHGRVLYDLADFDISPTTLQADLTDYIERFSIQMEK